MISSTPFRTTVSNGYPTAICVQLDESDMTTVPMGGNEVRNDHVPEINMYTSTVPFVFVGSATTKKGWEQKDGDMSMIPVKNGIITCCINSRLFCSTTRKSMTPGSVALVPNMPKKSEFMDMPTNG